MRRVARKVGEIRSWAESVNGFSDVLAAVLLSICRTRPPVGSGTFAKWFRSAIPEVVLRPRTLNGLPLSISPENLDQLIAYEEIFIQGLYDLSLLPFAPDIIVDCGGFGGYFTLLAKVRFPDAKFVAFEPNPDNYRLMCTNLKGVDDCFDLRNQAVSNYQGEACFEGSGLGGQLREGDQGLRVPVADLACVLATLSPRRLLLKLDVEGEEHRILPGLMSVLPSTCALFFEWHHSERDLATVQCSLQEAGFEVARRRTHSFEEKVFVDAFALRCSRTRLEQQLVVSDQAD